jgi:hypothetical protein
MSDDPSTDKLTHYHSGECFRNEKLPLYISKAARAQKPFGIAAIDVKAYYDPAQDAERAQIVTDIRHLIENACIPYRAGPIMPDVKVRDESRFYLMLRVADDIECSHLVQALYNACMLGGYPCAKLAAKSFDPATSHVTASQVLCDLESMLQ